MVHCGSGFYVRSLAHDIGAKIGCGAHLSALCRTAVGEYSLSSALSMEEITGALSLPSD
jgi:tRNA pseudouridine55 synthase